MPGVWLRRDRMSEILDLNLTESERFREHEYPQRATYSECKWTLAPHDFHARRLELLEEKMCEISIQKS